MAKKRRTQFAQDGQTAFPPNEVAQIINSVSAWKQPACKDEDEVESRIGEYFNLCVLKGEMPLFETLCLYLGIPDDKGKEFVQGEGCSTRMTLLMQTALTMLKATEGKAVYTGKMPYVPYIWRSKQYFNYREPNSKLEDLLAGSLLKDLPSPKNIAQKYLEDFEESEKDNDESGTDSGREKTTE